MIVTTLTVVGLATFAITFILVNVDGPFDIFLRFRKLFGVKYIPVLDDNGNVVEYIEETDSFLAKLVTCFWCLFWGS